MGTRRVWLVRHGEPLVTGALDPGLSRRGHAQAAALATGFPAPVALRTSPLRRARETAAAIEAAWRTSAVVDPAFAELPSHHTDVASRDAWLRFATRVCFADLDPLQRTWRDGILTALRALAVDTVITTHAVVINAVTGWCTGDDAVLAWVPAHCSITEIAIGVDGTISLVTRGVDRGGTVG